MTQGSDRPLYNGPFKLRYRSEFKLAPAIEYHIENVLPKGGDIMLYGAPGSGKSYVALSWALTLQSGRERWGDHRVNSQCNTLYICPEGFNGAIRRQMAWEGAMGLREPVNLAMLEHAVDLSDGEGKSIASLLGALIAQDYLPSLIIIDTLQRMAPGKDVSSGREMSAAFSSLDAFRWQLHERDKERPQPTVLLLHHTRRADKDFLGSQAILGWLDAMLFLEGEGDTIKLVIEKMRDDKKPPPLAIQFQTQIIETTKGPQSDRAIVGTLGLAEMPIDMHKTPNWKLNENAILKALAETGRSFTDLFNTARDLAATAAEDMPTKPLSRASFDRALQNLVKNQEVHHDEVRRIYTIIRFNNSGPVRSGPVHPLRGGLDWTPDQTVHSLVRGLTAPDRGPTYGRNDPNVTTADVQPPPNVAEPLPSDSVGSTNVPPDYKMVPADLQGVLNNGDERDRLAEGTSEPGPQTRGST